MLVADVYFNVGVSGVFHAGVGVHAESFYLIDRFDGDRIACLDVIHQLFHRGSHVGFPAVDAVHADGQGNFAVLGRLELEVVAGHQGIVLVGDIFLYPGSRLVRVYGDVVAVRGDPVHDGGVIQLFRADRIEDLFPVCHVIGNFHGADLVVQLKSGFPTLCGDGCLFVAVAFRHVDGVVALTHLRNRVVGQFLGVHHVAVIFRLDGERAVLVLDNLCVRRRHIAPVVGSNQADQCVLGIGVLDFYGVLRLGE